MAGPFTEWADAEGDGGGGGETSVPAGGGAGEPNEAALRGLRQTRSLFICCRQLRSLGQIRHLASMTGLLSLNVHMNLIQKVEGLHALRQLVELDLSANEIAELTTDCFAGLRQLRRLNLSSNALCELPEGVLAPLLALEWLSLSLNHLTDIRGLRSVPVQAPLSSLDLSGNRIATLAEVKEALASHRTRLRQLCLATHSTGGRDGLAHTAQGVRAVGLLRDNPLCAEPNYVEETLAHFTGLVRLNGVGYGVDPLTLPVAPVPNYSSSLATLPLLSSHSQVEAEIAHQLHSLSTRSKELRCRLHRHHHRNRHRRDTATDTSVSSSTASASQDGSSMTSNTMTDSSITSHPSSASSISRGEAHHRGHHRRHSAPQRNHSAQVHSTKNTPTPAPGDVRKNVSGESGGQELASPSPVVTTYGVSPSAGSSTSAREERSGRSAARALSFPTSTSAATATAVSAESPVTVRVPTATISPPLRPSSPPAVDSIDRHRRDAPDTVLRLSPQQGKALRAREAGSGSGTATAAADSRVVKDSRHVGSVQKDDLAPPPGRAGDAQSVCGGAVNNRTVLSTSTCSSSASTAAPLKWRTKHVSRGTNTDDVATGGSLAASQVKKTPTTQKSTQTDTSLDLPCTRCDTAQLALRRAQEQLTLRAAVEEDLRRQLALVRQRCLELQDEKQSAQRRLQSQVAALKDELTRRTQEQSIIRRKHAVELEQQIAHLREAHQKELEEVRKEAEAKMQEAVSTAVAAQQIKAEHAVHALREELEKREKEAERRVTTLSQQFRTALREHQRAAEDVARGAGLQRAQEQLIHEEAIARAAVELEAASATWQTHGPHEGVAEDKPLTFAPCAALAYRELLHLSQAERHSALQSWQQHREAYEEYCGELQAQCEDALQHSLQRCDQLQQRVRELEEEKEQTHSATHHHKQPQQEAESPSAAVEHGLALTMQPSSPVNDICTDQPPASSPVHGVEETPEATSHSSSSNKLNGVPIRSLPPSSAASPTLASTAYWKCVVERQEDELRRLRGVCRVAEETQTALHRENSRLLEQLQVVQEELQKQRMQDKNEKKEEEEVSAATTRERDNLLRTVHNLQEDLRKKDAAMDSLEAEALDKINDKRHRIAELEGELDGLQERLGKTTAQNAHYHDEIERLTSQLQEQHASTTSSDCSQRVRELEERLHSTAAQATQWERERARLVSALSLAREQLIRMHASHECVVREQHSAVAALAQRAAEVDALKTRLREVQESARAKQRATLEVLSHVMMAEPADAVGMSA